MHWHTLRSNDLAAVAYETRTRKLWVKFQQGGTRLYSGVPPAVFRALLNAASKGQYFDRHIRDAGYPQQAVGKG